MARKKKTKAEQVADIPIEIIARLGGESGIAQLRKYVQTLQTGYKRRVGQFKRHGLTSYAQISLEGSVSEPAKKRKVKDMTRNQLLMEFARYSKFFHDKTSTIEGIKEVNLEQDKRIFGTDEKGIAKGRMNEEDRKNFWSVYDEFIHQHSELISMYGSERVQQAISEVILEVADPLNFGEILNRATEKLSKWSREEPRHGPNVYSGRGPTFQ